MQSFREWLLQEKAPPGEAAEQWIKKNKDRFQQEYGDDWEEALYSTAWKLHNQGSFD